MKIGNLIGSVQQEQSWIPTQKPTILVADDDPAILEAMKIMLELSNFVVETIADGMVFQKLVSLQPDLLFLDIYMSGVDGRDVCRELKKTDATKHIPVILTSASCDLAHALQESGADDYLPKPFDMQDLLNKVNKYLLN